MREPVLQRTILPVLVRNRRDLVSGCALALHAPTVSVTELLDFALRR